MVMSWSDDFNTPKAKKASMQMASGTPEAEFCSFMVDDKELADCFLAIPEVSPEKPFLLDCETIATKQRAKGRLKLPTPDPNHRSQEAMFLEGPQLVVCRAKEGNKPQIRIPDSMLSNLAESCHLVLSDVGMMRLQQTAATNLEHPQLNATCTQVALHCDTCQMTKLFGQGHVHLPPREAQTAQ